MGFPHTRGKFTIKDHQAAGAIRVPPYAGEVYWMLDSALSAIRVSPIRGGSLPHEVFVDAISSSFPHTRGKFTCTVTDRPQFRSFPPYAGEVYHHFARCHVRQQFPPYAGEVYSATMRHLPEPSSFPHTRGKFTLSDCVKKDLVIVFPIRGGSLLYCMRIIN